MKLLYAYKMGEGKPVQDSNKELEVMAALLSDNDMVVLVVNHYSKQYHIEKVKNRFAIDLYRSDNFIEIDNDEEWKVYKNFLLDQSLLPEIFQNVYV